MVHLASQSFVFDPRPNYPFLISLKRYFVDRPSASETHLASKHPDALTLILGHGTGFQSEHWEPTLGHLTDMLAREKDSGVKIRDIWAIDAPNHGDAAILNEALFPFGYSQFFSWEEYGRAIHLVLMGFGTGVPVDFTRRNLVAIGHSMGAVGLILSTGHYPQIKYQQMHLCEPMMKPPHDPPGEALPKGAEKRRDIWDSREHAFQTLKSRPTFAVWDERVLRIHCEVGLRDLPTLDYPDKNEGVTLKCTRYQEAATYRDYRGGQNANRMLRGIAQRMPVHAIYGATDDYVSRKSKDAIIDMMGGRQALSSLTRVEGSGHLLCQIQPFGLAEKLTLSLTHPANRKASAEPTRTVEARL